MVLHLAARNLLRQRARTAMAFGAIAFGVAALILSGGFVHDLYTQLGEALIRSQSGHLQIARAELFAAGSRSPEKYLVSDAEAVRASLRKVAGVRQVMGRLNFTGVLGNGRSDFPVIVEGIEPAAERELSTSLMLLSGQMLASATEQGAMLGEGLAQSLGVTAGDSVTLVTSTLDGAMNTADFTVSGVFRSFSRDYDDRAVKIPLDAARTILDTKQVNTLVVLLADTAQTDSVGAIVSKQIAGSGLAMRTWREINDFYANTVALYDRQFTVLRLIILVMVLLGVANAINMSVFERTAEFGTMRALGNRNRFIGGLVLLECTLLGIAGALGGVVLGALLATLISAIGVPMPPPPNSNSGYLARIELVPAVVASAFAIGVIATMISGLLPSLRAARQPIVDALRSGV